jgi:hypothetical protein
MTEEEFIAKAKEMGMADSEIRERIDLKKEWDREGPPA